MRAVVIHEHGGRDKLILEEIPDPTPAPGEILLRVKAVGLNYLDIFVRRGMPGLPIDLPRISGGDIAGKVVALGKNVQSVSVGQRLLIDPAITMPDGHTRRARRKHDRGTVRVLHRLRPHTPFPCPTMYPMSKPPRSQSPTAPLGACSSHAASLQAGRKRPYPRRERRCRHGRGADCQDARLRGVRSRQQPRQARPPARTRRRLPRQLHRASPSSTAMFAASPTAKA